VLVYHTHDVLKFDDCSFPLLWVSIGQLWPSSVPVAMTIITSQDVQFFTNGAFAASFMASKDLLHRHKQLKVFPAFLWTW